MFNLISKVYFCFQITSGIKHGLLLLFLTLRLYCYYKFRKEKIKSINQKFCIQLSNKYKKIEIKLRLQDIAIFYEVFFSRTYKISKKYIKGGTVIDAGAHIGFTSLYLWVHHYPNSRFLCIEPSISNIELLRYNTKRLNCEIMNIALSNYCGEGYLDIAPLSYNYKLTTPNLSHSKIEIRTLQAIYEEKKISKIQLLKLDIEGEENIIFNNFENWLKKTTLIIVEVHDENRFTKILNSCNSTIKVEEKRKNIWLLNPLEAE